MAGSAPGHRRQSPAEPVALNLLLSLQAREDIRKGAHWYDERDPAVRARFLNSVGGAFDTILEAPERWPLVEGLPPNRHMRYYVMPVFPYTVVYQRRTEDTVEIVAVAHQKRRRSYWEVRRR